MHASSCAMLTKPTNKTMLKRCLLCKACSPGGFGGKYGSLCRTYSSSLHIHRDGDIRNKLCVWFLCVKSPVCTLWFYFRLDPISSGTLWVLDIGWEMESIRKVFLHFYWGEVDFPNFQLLGTSVGLGGMRFVCNLLKCVRQNIYPGIQRFSLCYRDQFCGTFSRELLNVVNKNHPWVRLWPK